MIVYLLNTDRETETRLRRLVETLDHSSSFVPCESVDEALNAPSAEIELLILDDCSDGQREMASSARGEDGLPRWAVFETGWESADEEVISLPLEIDKDAYLSRVIGHGVDRHCLRRKSERIVGDLRTVATRFCHDFRTPMTSIQTAAYGLKMLCEQGGPQERMLTPISAATRDLARLTDQLALFSRSWSTSPQVTPVVMQEIFVQARQNVEGRFPGLDLKLREPNEWPEVGGQPSWIAHLWETFLAYSVHRSKGAAEIEVTWHEDGESDHRFEVEVEGLPVQAEELEHLFLPFHVLADERGRGDLQFSLALRFARLMGGTCGYSLPSEGHVCFHFTLPRV